MPLHVVSALEEPPKEWSRSIFLAGPTPRSPSVPSWRPEALALLEQLGYDGVVFVPENSQANYQYYYHDQVLWEKKMLAQSDVIVFWIPRAHPTMPALTTNDEWGYYKSSGKVVLGVPSTASDVGYQKWWANHLSIPVSNTLKDTLRQAHDLTARPALRSLGERAIPLNLWHTESFQTWYKSRQAAGDTLIDAQVSWTTETNPRSVPFVWSLRPTLWSQEEKRFKKNEVVIFRPDLAQVLAYHMPTSNIMDAEILLVSELRSSVSNGLGRVFELPGGSSSDPLLRGVALAAQEFLEETGLTVSHARFNLHSRRQCAPTLSSHGSILYSLPFARSEWSTVRALHGTTIGDQGDDSEFLHLHVKTVKELLTNDYLDWTTLGQCLSVLTSFLPALAP